MKHARRRYSECGGRGHSPNRACSITWRLRCFFPPAHVLVQGLHTPHVLVLHAAAVVSCFAAIFSFACAIALFACRLLFTLTAAVARRAAAFASGMRRRFLLASRATRFGVGVWHSSSCPLCCQLHSVRHQMRRLPAQSALLSSAAARSHFRSKLTKL